MSSLQKKPAVKAKPEKRKTQTTNKPGARAARSEKPQLTREQAIAQRIARGATAHYRDAAYYDHAYKRRYNDVRFYTELAAQRKGPVLELGVGTARVALALAKAGIETVGVDLVPEMLARAKEKQATLPVASRNLLTLRQGDIRTLRLKRRFPWVFSPFNVFMHLYTREDMERTLKTVRAHLAPGGRFVFDVLMPDLHAMVRNPARLYRAPVFTSKTSGKKVAYFESFDYQPIAQVQMVSMVFQTLDEVSDLKVVPLSQRQFFPQELEMLLHYNGFKIEHRWGDFAHNPLSADSESQVIVARAR